MFQTKFVQKIKTCYVFNYVSPENRAVYEIRGKIWYSQTGHRWQKKERMRFACWIIKVTDIHWEYVIILIFHSNIGYANAPQNNVVRRVPLLFISWVAEKLLKLLQTNGQPNHPPGQSIWTTHVFTLVPPYKQDVTFLTYDELLVSFSCRSNWALRVNYHNATSVNYKLCANWTLAK